MRTKPTTKSHGHRHAATAAHAVLLLTGLLVSTHVPEAKGQVNASVASGTRVRITAPSRNLSMAVGSVRETTEEALVVDFEHGRTVRTLRIDRMEIAAIDVSIRRERRSAKGAAIGAAVGAGIGAPLGFALGGLCDRSCSRAGVAVILGMVYGAIGGSLGLMVGSLIRRDVWSSASPSPARVTLRPHITGERTAFDLGLSIPFR